MKQYYFAAVLAVLTVPLVSCTDTRPATNTTLFHSEVGRQLTAAQCVADANWLFDFIDNHHPNPYWRTSKHEFYIMRTNDIRIIRENAPMDALELWTILSPAVGKIYDPHTFLWFDQSLYGNVPIICPIIFTRCCGAFYPIKVEKRYSGILGKKVVAVNGIPISEYFSNIVVCNPKLYGYPEEIAEQKLTPFVAYMPEMNYGLFGFQGELKLTVEDGGSNFIYPVQMYTRKKLGATNLEYSIYPSAYANNEIVSDTGNSPYFFTLVSNHIGYIHIKTFRMSATVADNKIYCDFLKSSFRTLQEKHVPYLIIDITGNEGGADAAWMSLMAYVYPQPFLFSAGNESPTTREHLKQLMLRYGYVDPGYDFEWDKYLYTGKVYLLEIRPFSSSANCAIVMKYYHTATIIGPRFSGLVTLFGNVKKTNLPESGLQLYYTTSVYRVLGWNGTPQDFVPDVELDYNYTNIAEYWSPGRETVYSKVMELIRADWAGH